MWFVDENVVSSNLSCGKELQPNPLNAAIVDETSKKKIEHIVLLIY